MSVDRSATAAVLVRAADIIREHGWCQRTSQAPTGEVCAGMAIDLAAQQLLGLRTYGPLDRVPDGPNTIHQYAVRAFKTAADTRNIVRWNDAEDRTVDDVLNAFNRAAREESSS